MSLKTSNSKNLGPTRRFFDQDTSFAPFEVIDVGDKKVAINEGVLIHGSSAITYDDINFTGSCKPQNLLGGEIVESRCLTVKKNDYVIILLTDNESSKPKAEIKAVQPSELDKEAYKKKKHKVIKLAQITDEKTLEGASYMKIKNLYLGQVITDTENWPAFTPIIWPVEKVVTEGEPSGQTVWKAVFIPGSVYLPQTMDECKVFEIDGKSMLDLPIVEVKKGDKWYVTYEIDKKWKIKNKPTFTKSPEDKEIVKVVPEGPECDDVSSSTSDSPCTPKEGYFKLKVLEFEEKGSGGLSAKMYWKSDICIYGWERCPSNCDGSDSESENESSSSDEPPDSSSGDPPPDPSSDSDSESSDEPDPDPWCCADITIDNTLILVVENCNDTGEPGGCSNFCGGACFTDPSGGPCLVTGTATFNTPAFTGGFDCGDCFRLLGVVVVDGCPRVTRNLTSLPDWMDFCVVRECGVCEVFNITASLQMVGTTALQPGCNVGNASGGACPSTSIQVQAPFFCDDGTCNTTPNPPGMP